MPEFDKQPIKFETRQHLVSIYRQHSGHQKLPRPRRLWSLCSTQTKRDTAEINQLISEGLITKAQYVGVDWDARKIKGNVRRHPEANWLPGDWETVIKRNHKVFDPGIVFLDFTSLASTSLLLTATKRTLRLCPDDTYLFVNVMLNNPRDPRTFFTIDSFPTSLAEILSPEDFKGWKSLTYKDCKKFKGLPFMSKIKSGILCLTYSCTGHTQMAMYSFYKGNSQ